MKGDGGSMKAIDYRSLSSDTLFDMVREGDYDAWDEIVRRRELRLDETRYKIRLIG